MAEIEPINKQVFSVVYTFRTLHIVSTKLDSHYLPSLSHSTLYHVCRSLSDSQFTRYFPSFLPTKPYDVKEVCRSMCASCYTCHVACARIHLSYAVSPTLVV
jgi:hypothetical protein